MESIQNAAIWRRKPTLLVTLAAVAIVAGPIAGGCSDNDDEVGAITPAGTSTAPAGSATQRPGATPVGTATRGSDIQIPTNAQDYAEAVFAAWEAGDTATLDELAADEALRVFESAPYDPALDWTAAGCSAGAGSVACSWQAASGETLEILIDNAMASSGAPDAAVEARFA